MAPKPYWLIWINPRPSMRLTIGSKWLFWRLPDSNWSSANGLAWCTTTCRQWCKWTGNTLRLSWLSGWSGRVAPSPTRYVLALELLLCRLRDEQASPALRGIPFAGPLLTKVSVYADDITAFVSWRLHMKAVKNAVARYKQRAGAKINFDKSEMLWLGARRAFKLGWWTHLHLRSVVWAQSPTGAKLSEVQAKVGLFLKSRVEVCTMYILPLIIYHLTVLTLPKNHLQALQWSLSKLLWGGRRPMVHRQVCCQHLCNGV